MRQPMPFGGESWLSTCARASSVPAAQAEQKAPEGGKRRAAPEEVRRLLQGAGEEERAQAPATPTRTGGGMVDALLLPANARAAPSMRPRLQPCPGEVGQMGATVEAEERKGFAPAPGASAGLTSWSWSSTSSTVSTSPAPASGTPESAPSRMSSLLARVRAKEARARSAC